MALKNFTLPPDTRVSGQGSPAADFDQVLDALLASGTAYNVLSTAWNADPSGVADSTAAIQACLTAAATAGMPTVIPAGTYKLSGVLNLADGQLIQGAGMNSTILQQTSLTADTFVMTDKRYVTIRDLQLVGPGQSSGTGRGIAFHFSAVPLAGINLTNVVVQQFGGNGIQIETPITSTITNVRAQLTGGHGFYVSGGTSVSMKACYANNCLANGFEIDGVAYCELDACAADNVVIGYQLSNSTSVALNGCGTEQPQVGFKLTGGSCANVVMLGCRVYQETSVAYWVTAGAVFAVLVACREASPNGATYAIQVDTGCSATVIMPETVSPNNCATGTTNFFMGTNLEVHTTGTSRARVDRGDTAHTAAYMLQTGGSDKWSMQLSTPDSNFRITDVARSLDLLGGFDQPNALNLWLLTQPASWGGLQGGIFIADDFADPTSNPSAGTMLFSSNGILKTRDRFGGTIALSAPSPTPAMLYGAPTGATGQTCDRNTATNTGGTLTSSQVYFRQIILAGGTPISNISLFTTAGTVVTQANLTHGWYALCDSSYVVRAVSADQINVPFLSAANTEYSLAVSAAAYSTIYTGLFYVAFSVSVSAGSLPQLACSASLTTGVGTAAPVICGGGGTQAAPPATGVTLTAPTFQNTCVFYAYTH